jgi:hypothetical protein
MIFRYSEWWVDLIYVGVNWIANDRNYTKQYFICICIALSYVLQLLITQISYKEDMPGYLTVTIMLYICINPDLEPELKSTNDSEPLVDSNNIVNFFA